MVAQQNHRHDGPNSAFRGTPEDESWIELYHSRPSWATSQISYRKDDGPWVPFGKFQLIDASDVRPGFRVFRIKAERLEFRLADERACVVDSNLGRNYVISAPGRYVVESGDGCRRVSDAQIADCLRAIRPQDKYVELSFESDPLWRKCYVTFAKEGDEDPTWHKVPMDARYREPGVWFGRIEAARGLTCAFNNGANEWDSNRDRNYQIRLPGKYVVGGGRLMYCGAADLDIHMA